MREAMTNFNKAMSSLEYGDFNRALYGFEHSLFAWRHNDKAREHLHKTRFWYSKTALENGDIGLANAMAVETFVGLHPRDAVGTVAGFDIPAMKRIAEKPDFQALREKIDAVVSQNKDATVDVIVESDSIAGEDKMIHVPQSKVDQSTAEMILRDERIEELELTIRQQQRKITERQDTINGFLHSTINTAVVDNLHTAVDTQDSPISVEHYSPKLASFLLNEHPDTRPLNNRIKQLQHELRSSRQKLAILIAAIVFTVFILCLAFSLREFTSEVQSRIF